MEGISMLNQLARILAVCASMSLSSIGFSTSETPDDLWIDLPYSVEPEIVMPVGSQINVDTEGMALNIAAPSPSTRIYTWDDGACTRTMTLWPRTERWNGMSGLYYPGVGDHWSPCHGVRRGVLEEGQLHFATLEHVKEWLRLQKAACESTDESSCHLVYSKDGLFVRFGKNLSRKQLNVDVIQILIDGRKPEDLPESTDDLTISAKD
jgi:hypothetical protein